jgi:hypothetical protein
MSDGRAKKQQDDLRRFGKRWCLWSHQPRVFQVPKNIMGLHSADAAAGGAIQAPEPSGK